MGPTGDPCPRPLSRQCLPPPPCRDWPCLASTGPAPTPDCGTIGPDWRRAWPLPAMPQGVWARSSRHPAVSADRDATALPRRGPPLIRQCQRRGRRHATLTKPWPGRAIGSQKCRRNRPLASLTGIKARHSEKICIFAPRSYEKSVIYWK